MNDVSVSFFGALSDGTPVHAACMKNSSGASVTILDYGATVQSLIVPDRSGVPTDVVLGYDTAVEYETQGGHLGGTIGRVGNRIGGASFSLNGKTYPLAKNNGENHLHGGKRGFDKLMWNMDAQDGSLVFERLSPDGEEGYPGNLNVRVTFTLTPENALRILYEAESDRDTLFNPTNHAYFNLNGGGSAEGHHLQIFAERFCENDANGLPTGKLLYVENTPFDFRAGKIVGDDIGSDDEQLHRCNGYDHNYCLSGRRAAVLTGERSGIVLTTLTDMPGMQFYSSNSLTRRPGKRGVPMAERGAICLETQLYPNGIHLYGFPSPVLRAGVPMRSETVYAFSVQ